MKYNQSEVLRHKYWLPLAAAFTVILFTVAVVSNALKTADENTVTADSSPTVTVEHVSLTAANLATKDEINMLTKLLYMEARGVESDTEKAAVVWCVLNRVDSPLYPNTITEVLTQPKQFAYDETAPIQMSLQNIVTDVLSRWYAEKMFTTDVGRVLPKEYIYFDGDGTHNYFRTEHKDGQAWDWNLLSPYEN